MRPCGSNCGHVTAVVRGGLCRLTSAFADPNQLTVQFTANDCVLMTPPGVPLIEQEGNAGVENFRRRFVWSGERNFYQDVDSFWTVRSLDPETPPDMMDFEAWKAYWGPSRENQPSTERLPWKKLPNTGQPLHIQDPMDYTLVDPTFGDAASGAPALPGRPSAPLPPETPSKKYGGSAGRRDQGD